MKHLTLILFSLLLSLETFAQTDYSSYYRQLPKAMPVAETPSIPDTRVSLADYGGKGDGVTMNTQAFAKAISALNKQGGGHLDVPAGVWLTGLISLKSHIDLHLDRNAVILFSPDKHDLIKNKDGKWDDKASPCITASKRTDVSITGFGVIDGNGEYWRPVKRSKVSDVEWKAYQKLGGTVTDNGQLWYPFQLKHYTNVAESAEAQEEMRTHLVRFTDCDRVLVKDVTLRNSPKFHLVPQRSSNVIIDGVKIVCPWNAQNGDAMDIGNCKNVLIVNNVIDAGDDGICMKGGAGEKGLSYGPCENINIQDNRVYHAHGGFVIGSEFSGGMKNIYVHNNVFAGTDNGLRFKSSAGRGGLTSDIYISNIYMTDISDAAIVFQCDYVDRPAGSKDKKAEKANQFLPQFNDIHISDVVCRGSAVGVQAHGEGVMGVDISHSTLFYTDKGTDIGTECNVKMQDVTLKSYE